MNVKILRSRQTEWDQFVGNFNGATAYHLFEWGNVFNRSFGHPCHYLAAIDEDGTWRGILPLVHMRSRLFGNFLISLPFVNYGGLLCENAMAADLLIEEAEKLRRNCGATYVELRHIAPVEGNMPTRRHKVTMLLELGSTADGLWRGFDPKLRNQIRKSQKSGLTFKSGQLDLLNDFYEVFARNMRDLGTPVYSKTFFYNVLSAFPDKSAIGAVYLGERVISAGLVVWFKGRFEVPWASSIRDFNALCPNHLLYWELIQFAIGRGCTLFDFGRSTAHEGTYNFKKQWGAEPVQLNWQYVLDRQGDIPELSPRNPKYQLAIRAWRRLPVPITKVLGPLIVRNIP